VASLNTSLYICDDLPISVLTRLDVQRLFFVYCNAVTPEPDRDQGRKKVGKFLVRMSTIFPFLVIHNYSLEPHRRSIRISFLKPFSKLRELVKQ